ncbi:MAG TPA: serine hydrolase [Rhizomicrobium sp.]|jgi:CubicO group peptidase (beta-lactamase class C family)|nr:serine hydrolase [Rhizomicrobium sp.]
MQSGQGVGPFLARAAIALTSFATSLFLFSCTHTTAISNTAENISAKPSAPVEAVSWPTAGWPVSTPEAQGLDSTVLADALEQIRARHIPIHSLLIERHGKVVLDSYFYPFADNKTHNVYSVTKSVTAMLVGIAMAEHRLDDLNAPVYPMLAVQTSDDPRKAHITLANLLSMTSGLDCRGEGNTTLLQEMLRSRHLAAYMLSRPADDEPGTVFDYCGGNSEVVSAVLTKTTGTSALDLARAELFAPLGITNVSWPTDTDGVSHGWGDLELQPRDMAKLGYLWLHDGRWKNRQIIPADYLAKALTSHISVQPGIEYGYGMWLYPGHKPVDFEANGTGGQRITVIPSLDMVEVMTGGGFDANEVQQLIAPAPRSDTPLPANPHAFMRLASISAELARSPVETRIPAVGAAAIPTPRPKPQPDLRPQAIVAEAITPKRPSVGEAAPSIPTPRPKASLTKS